ncbi:MAG: FAD-dependent monooxygenase [Rhodobiaceae bacterium]|nr:FAD-dependent monooxygenase [Rhodobiaceae bacterium]MCC0055977.1 FAD-dependent monooxygenase [Rhodobiaceae bacterium]
MMRVLVCGGGIAGLSTAIALGGNGHEVRVIERSRRWQTGGAGLHLPGNAHAPMTYLGIAEDVARAGKAIPRIDYHSHRGNRLFSLNLAKKGWPPFQAIRRADFHEILRRRASAIEIGLGLEVASLEQGDDAAVRFSDGTTGRYDLIVGADGINSRMRAALFGEASAPRDMGLTCWRWTTDHPFEIDAPQFMVGCGSAALIMPLGGSRYYVYTSIEDPDRRFVDAAPAALAGILNEYDGAFGEMLTGLGPEDVVLSDRLVEARPTRWIEGRACLVGDAAHGTLPTIAQGAAQAMEDAVALAEELELGNDIPAALNRWQGRRMPRARWVQDQSVKRMKLARLKAKPAVATRNMLFRMIGPMVLAGGWRPLIEEPF